MIDADLGVAAVAPVADDGRVARGAELAGFIARVFLEVMVRIEDPLTVADTRRSNRGPSYPNRRRPGYRPFGRNGP